MKNILLNIVTLMIAYDLSIHLFFLLSKEDYFINKKVNWWPNFKNLSPRTYQVFWCLYWGIAFTLVLISIFI